MSTASAPAILPAGQPLEIKDWRKQYKNEKEPHIDESKFDADPFHQFDHWFKDVSGRPDLTFEETNAACLSTCINNKPSSRMLLIKKYDAEGFHFYTNSISRKGRELAANPNAAILFYWAPVSRQVRIEGTVTQLPVSAADDYWYSRPLASRIGSKASTQGVIVASRHVLEEEKARLTKISQTEGGQAITRPEGWLGYVLHPTSYEFWQGQSDRLHDRIVYEKTPEGGWTKKRLSP